MVSGRSESRLSAQRQRCLFLSLGTHFMKVVPQPWGVSKGLAGYFLQALMPPTPPPTLGCSDRRLLHAFQGDVQINDRKGKGEKAQRFKGGSPPT